MSHMTVTVAIPGNVAQSDLRAALEAALAPYDETLEVAPYVRYPKAEVDADEQFQKWWKKVNAAAGTSLPYAKAAVEWYGGEVDKDGNVLSTYNPKSQWDWWVVGGRWAGSWELSGGAERAVESEHGAFTPDEIDDRRRTDSARKSQIAGEVTPSFAYLDVDGEWHERGRMGWWAIVSDEKAESEWDAEFRAWLDGLPDDTWLVNVDCHI